MRFDMKLIVPHTGELQAADTRLLRMAKFLGVHCEPLRLVEHVRHWAEYIEKAVPDQNSCLVINPTVIREWIGGDVVPPELVTALVSRFPYILVHAPTLDPFAATIVAAMSNRNLHAVQPIADTGQPYEISSNAEAVCGPFSGLSFGPINAVNDRVFALGSNDSTVRKLISIGGLPHMAAVRRDRTEILFLAGEDTADVDAEIGSESVWNYFSRLIPQAMALRYIFGEACWRPAKAFASIIIDDPLLRQNYGYLNFKSLLGLMEEHNFHTTISFIPHNYRRNSSRIIRMFRENSHRLSICFHGNDHTESELGSTDPAVLNRVLGIAEERMTLHEQVTGLHCDKVMVFPQDSYSAEAMELLKARNFHAAVSSPYPVCGQVPLRISDFAQPALLRYKGFPLFVRNFIRHTRSQDIAFNFFFGRPVLIGEHHDTFRHPDSLLEVVHRINSIAPGISWSHLESVANNSTLKRRRTDGTLEVRAYSKNALIANDSDSVQRYSIEWSQDGQGSRIDRVLRDKTRFPVVEYGESGIRVLAELPPHTSEIFSVVYRNCHSALANPSFIWGAKVFLRRRLSEVRDNYLSKNQYVLTAAKSLQRRFLK